MRIVAEEREAEAADAQNAMKEEEVGLTIDDTSEFVQAVSLDAKPERRIMVLEIVKREASEDEDMEELEAGEVDPKMEEEMLALKMELDKQFGDEEIVKREDDGDLQVSNIFFLITIELMDSFCRLARLPKERTARDWQAR